MCIRPVSVCQAVEQKPEPFYIALQQHGAEAVARNALHTLMGLEASPIQAGGFKYIHRDTGLIFEIAPASPDSAGTA